MLKTISILLLITINVFAGDTKNSPPLPDSQAPLFTKEKPAQMTPDQATQIKGINTSLSCTPWIVKADSLDDEVNFLQKRVGDLITEISVYQGERLYIHICEAAGISEADAIAGRCEIDPETREVRRRK